MTSAELDNLVRIGKLKRELVAARRVLAAIEALPESGTAG